MIIWTFFHTADVISRHKKCYLPNALRPVSFSYLDLYCVEWGNKKTKLVTEKYVCAKEMRKASSFLPSGIGVEVDSARAVDSEEEEEEE